MTEKPYDFEKRQTEFRYDFTSTGHKGQLQKIVVLTITQFQDVFNLALLDVLEDGSVSDETETKNGDMPQIMATIVKIIEDFLNENPNKWVLFKGSDKRRHRLYRVILSREIELIRKEYHVFGQLENGNFEPFKIGKDYSAYTIKKIRI